MFIELQALFMDVLMALYLVKHRDNFTFTLIGVVVLATFFILASYVYLLYFLRNGN
jgi:hypothetical protein